MPLVSYFVVRGPEAWLHDVNSIFRQEGARRLKCSKNCWSCVQDDQLPFGEPVGEQLGKPPAMLDVEAVDHVVEDQESELLVEAPRHGQKQRDRERVQV